MIFRLHQHGFGNIDADITAGGITITDYGCGYGAFFHYLKDRPVMMDSRYIGIDISEAMLVEAENHTRDPRVNSGGWISSSREAGDRR